MYDLRYLLKTHYSNSRALIIGINNYKSASPLGYAVNDATEIREIFIDKLNFKEGNITFLIDDNATKENILREFMRLTNTDIDLDERIFIFFAGHGHTLSGIRGEVGFLVPYDAKISDSSTLIRWNELTDCSELIRAKHVLFIMDACYGGLALNRSLKAGSTRFLKDMMKRYSRQVLTAGKADEVVADSGGPIPNHSIFTGHLIEGLQGKAFSEEGILTANGLMSYVYGKVSTDKNSNQTPHYGYFDGDGDFIFQAPKLSDLDKDDYKDIDMLVSVPYYDDDFISESTSNKINKIKTLLANDSSSIELHDIVIEEVRYILLQTNEDNFKVNGNFSQEELIERISKYENICYDLSLIVACISHWAKPIHKSTLQKVFTRSTDHIDSQSGLTAWLSLRLYPSIVELYCAGIAAVENKRYDSLVNIFYANANSPRGLEYDQYLVEVVTNGISDLKNHKIFNNLPGYERHYTPLSEHLYKITQPMLDDILFIGKGFDRSFDEFEVLLALVVADLRILRKHHLWGPIGRFGWKIRWGENSPFPKIVKEAKSLGNDWEPIKAGLFGGDFDRFLKVADDFTKILYNLGWD